MHTSNAPINLLYHFIIFQEKLTGCDDKLRDKNKKTNNKKLSWKKDQDQSERRVHECEAYHDPGQVRGRSERLFSVNQSDLQSTCTMQCAVPPGFEQNNLLWFITKTPIDKRRTHLPFMHSAQFARAIVTLTDNMFGGLHLILQCVLEHAGVKTSVGSSYQLVHCGSQVR